MHFIIAIMIMIFELLVFYTFGSIVVSKVDVSVALTMKPVIGCFAFYAIINPLYIFCIFLRLSTTFFGVLVSVVVLLAFVIYFKFFRPKGKIVFNIRESIVEHLPLCIIMVPLAVLIIYYSIRSAYMKYDTLFYVQCIRDAAYHNTMYQSFNPGSEGTLFGLKYLLCSYYMVLAFVVRVTAVPAVIIAKVVGGGCAVLSILIAYSFGAEIFSDRYAVMFSTIIWSILNFCDMSYYTATTFLMERSYEGKAWCASVILPFLLMLFYHLFKHPDDQKWWFFVLLVCMSCDSISMSSLLSAPAMVIICSVMILCKVRKVSVIKYCMLCELPLAMYCLAIILEIKGIIKILA